MSDACPKCPCADACLKWDAFCAWAAEEPPDPVRLAHIRARSAMGVSLHEAPPTPEVAAKLRLYAAARTCPFRSARGCGCGGARCALRVDPDGPADPPRRGAFVTLDDCAACLMRFG